MTWQILVGEFVASNRQRALNRRSELTVGSLPRRIKTALCLVSRSLVSAVAELAVRKSLSRRGSRLRRDASVYYATHSGLL